MVWYWRGGTGGCSGVGGGCLATCGDVMDRRR